MPAPAFNAMEQKLSLDQDKINAVWSRHWQALENSKIKDLLENPLFTEGYKVVKNLIRSGAKTILDAGGGSGRYAIKFAQDNPGAKIILADIVPDSFGFVQKLAVEFGVKNLEIKREDILNFNFPADSFDVVFCDAVIQHLPDWEKAVSELSRVVKPGGVLVISVVNFWNLHSLFKAFMGKRYEYGFEKSFTKKELRRLMMDNNLSVLAEEGFYPAYGILRLKKYHRIFKFIGRAMNYCVKRLDRVSDRFFSKNFGFQILIAGKK